jgi:Na+:H+ antiporter, NhaA family
MTESASAAGESESFLSTEAASGLLLLLCAAIALAWANSPGAERYRDLWAARYTIGAAPGALTLSLHDWVNDGLMAVFFLVVGLEIKREVLMGELATRRSAALPVAAALGGMLVPATFYAMLNHGGPGDAGWGIPMATDIAFALGILALLGHRVPSGLRVFLAALAIADDLGAVLVIAFFYTAALHGLALAIAAIALLALVVANRRGVRHLGVYLAVGLVVWLAVLASGVHATVAGVLVALTIPARPVRRAADADAPIIREAPLQRLEQRLHGVVAFGIMPLFALANAGVAIGGGLGEMLRSPVALGIMIGLVAGKPIGIMLASILAVRTGAAELPASVHWRHIHGAAWLGGIGFTMSLFIAGLAFAEPAMLDSAKLAVMSASLLAGAVGYALLRLATHR